MAETPKLHQVPMRHPHYLLVAGAAVKCSDHRIRLGPIIGWIVVGVITAITLAGGWQYGGQWLQGAL